RAEARIHDRPAPRTAGIAKTQCDRVPAGPRERAPQAPAEHVGAAAGPLRPDEPQEGALRHEPALPAELLLDSRSQTARRVVAGEETDTLAAASLGESRGADEGPLVRDDLRCERGARREPAES